MGFLSLSVRLLMNLESLNSVETIGSLVRHRTAPIAVPVEEGFVLRFVPVVSGESIAHAYQEMLVKEAFRLNLPVGVYSSRGEFVKFADDRFMKEEGIKPPENEDDILRAEIDVLLKDIVADIGGFLYAGNYSIKRTSRFQVGYMIPALKEVDVAALEAQFHVRMVPSRATERGKRGLAPPQAPFNVEVGSAVYTFTFNLDIDGIAEPSTKFGKLDEEKLEQLKKQKHKRIKAAIISLAKLLSGMEFGAKRTRFLPNTELLSAVLAYSKNGSFVVSPGNSKDYVELTVKRSNGYLRTLKSLGYNDVKVELIAVDKEKATKDVEINVVETIEDLLGWIAEKVLKE
ncbi:MAG: type I-A CRISPR-associated protein Cas7/Csa2 [Candidatus Nealsonbacteria bacterium]|nr:MAG: type I-A CRISPR-associated protein Cas7/Csa2 [Candidatus Nealsonbacteria bacterium]